jgi:formylglycine-generating enzyme required for sulfatase activity
MKYLVALLLAASTAMAADKTTAPTKVTVPKIDMVSLEGGTFKMGCVSGIACKPTELPIHTVTVKPFHIGTYEVTFDQWDACVAAGACSTKPDDRGWGRGNMPVMGVNWQEVTTQFIPWLNSVTDGGYRLPTEAEWEFAARAGTTTPFAFGTCITSKDANFDGNFPFVAGKCEVKSAYRRKNTAVGSFKPNAFGIYDMHGNVMEMVQDCWATSYSGAPTDGSARTNELCGKKMTRRGGAYADEASILRSAARDWDRLTDRYPDLGFRLARTPK